MTRIRFGIGAIAAVLVLVATGLGEEKMMAVAEHQVGSITGHVEKIDKLTISVKVDQTVQTPPTNSHRTSGRTSPAMSRPKTKTTHFTLTYTLADNIKVRDANNHLKPVDIGKVAVGDLVMIHIHKARVDKADPKADIQLVVEYIDVSHNGTTKTTPTDSVANKAPK